MMTKGERAALLRFQIEEGLCQPSNLERAALLRFEEGLYQASNWEIAERLGCDPELIDRLRRAEDESTFVRRILNSDRYLGEVQCFPLTGKQLVQAQKTLERYEDARLMVAYRKALPELMIAALDNLEIWEALEQMAIYLPTWKSLARIKGLVRQLHT